MSELSAQEAFEIGGLYSRYNLCSDLGDPDGYADCFTADGVLELMPHELRIAGRAALHGHKVRDLATRQGYRRHWNGNLLLERRDDGSVRGRCYLMAFNGPSGELPAIGDCGVYEDDIVLDGGTWRFRRRLLTMDASTWTRR
ncbi:nuclear transport factor 2 family protein [Azospirillum brasilense]|uniref:Nuclear transport factor 2 family protein n=1 Tax=Azospirillum brasilense TaxID=192 RepID=A0A0P0EKR2_AZOBR|nr:MULTISPECIES: nuclear transport factor 2 family protein [Azospirillum]ALJ34503.1 hypothetical protein AMK58_03170 [Azospirillum brasilense]MDW7554150.1 nuclear transport factor 2 family protein [Azospirillum brasilense]MDW7593591.1 nuclear transport factor 2 family protein [Azospirillum brasilense]MDW7627166.1 nuclear transport factor 2 family protein [Azospirillum brasilense]MDX5953130.1 nuclear transport factor 2 family protein [Azospirillum brasilense]